MAEAETMVELPRSVHRYCTDSRVRTAVDVLLAGKAPAMPEGTSWDEMPDFYLACLAAQQTKVEWAIALDRLWNAVWFDQLAGWNASSVRQQASESGLKMDPESLWTGDSYMRDHHRGETYLETWVELLPAETGIRIGIARYDDGEDVSITTGEFELINDYLSSSIVPLGETPEVSVTSLRGAAVRMLALAEQAAPALSAT